MDRTVLDMVGDLRGYQAPAGMDDRARRANVSIQVMGDQDRAEVLAFEAMAFPSWLRWFEHLDGSALVARNAQGAVVGLLLFRGPPDATIFVPLLGSMAGTIGCVGVTTRSRGAGVGSAMVARASELLRDAGTHACLLGWTEREGFYARLGYVPWRRYRMSRRPIGGRRAS